MSSKSFIAITGASKGIGKALAFEFASRGFPVILVARTETELIENANEIRKRFSVDARIWVADISSEKAAENFREWMLGEGLQLGGLVNNAGFTVWGRFHEMPLESHLEMLDLNVTAILRWTHVLAPELKKNTRAFILNVSSTGSFQPTPFMNVYGASKVFIRHFSRALRLELKPGGISVTCLMPGPTYSSMHIRSKNEELVNRAGKLQMTAERVAKIAVNATLSGKAECVPGLINQLNFWLSAFFPFSLSVPVAARVLRKKEK